MPPAVSFSPSAFSPLAFLSQFIIPGDSPGESEADYFIDSVNGDDSNSGRSASAAFQTLAAVTSYLDDNKTIGLVRGSYWREQFPSMSGLSGITIKGVGTGTLPTIDASDIASNASFSKTGGQTNVYEISWEPESEGYVIVWEDDVRLTWVADVATCDSTPGTFHILGDVDTGRTSAGTHTVYVHGFASDDVTSNGKQYDIAKRAKSLALPASSTGKFLHTRRQVQADGSCTAGDGALLEDCLFTGGGKHCSIIYGGGTYRRCYAGWDCETDERTGSILMEFYTPDGSGLSCVYEDCVAVGLTGGANNGIAGFHGHNTGGQPYFASWSMEGCTAVNCVNALEADKIPYCKSNLFINSTLRISPRDGDAIETTSVDLTDNWFVFTDIAASQAVSTLSGFGSASNVTIDMTGTRLYVDEATSGNVSSFLSTTDGNYVKLHDSVIYINDAVTSGLDRLLVGASGATWTTSVKNTAFFKAHPSGAAQLYINNSGTSCVIDDTDYNVYRLDGDVGALRYTDDTTDYGLAHNDTGLWFSHIQPTQEVNSTSAYTWNFTDPANGDWSIAGTDASSVTALGSGLSAESAAITYIDTPANLAAAITYFTTG